MKFAIFDSNGFILRTGECPDGEAINQAGDGEFIYEGIATVNDRINTFTGELIPDGYPARPGPEYNWDIGSMAWVIDLAKYKLIKKAAIELARDVQISEPISYSGAIFDADEASLDRIGKKLLTNTSLLDAGITPAIGTLVWRDADNTNHTFGTLTEFQTWLQGLAIAIDARGLDAFVLSWSRKAELEAATNKAEIDAIATE